LVTPAIGARTTGGETSIGPIWTDGEVITQRINEKRRGDRGV
jgi:hypothetical protein